MRRAIAVAIVSGLGILAAAAVPAWVGASAAPRQWPALVATKVVSYGGVQVRVPANWPVYRLDLHPSTCVRYDIHAVYLGTPGVNQQCPAHLVGRTQTISIVPSATPSAQISYQRAQLGMTGGTQVGSLPAVRAPLVQNAEQHVFRVAVGGAGGTTVVATYANSPAPAEQILTSLRTAPPGVHPQKAQSTRKPQGTRKPQSTQKPQDTQKAQNTQRTQTVQQADSAHPKPQPTSSGWHGVPSNWPIQKVVQSPRPHRRPHKRQQPARPVYGFDTCAAPSLATMNAWRHAYRVVGIYIGGVNAACGYGNLSASWIRSAAAMGWSMLPTYVGPQSACWGGGGVLIDSRHAAAQGRAAADDAISDLSLLGLRHGSPVYYDMEAYDETNGGCVSAVLTFISGWDWELEAHGYFAGVYSSQDSGIVDMQAATAHHRHRFVPPGAIWIAHWDDVRTLSDGTLTWFLSDRIKQYIGPHFHTVNGVTMDIDTDWVGGPVTQ
jgi:hypothetical protein